MQISFDRLFAKNLQLFFAKLVQFVSLCQRLSKKLNFIKIWQVKLGQNKDLVCYRKKQSFRQCAWGLRQLVLKPSFRPKGRALGMWEKSENFNSLRPVLFELCKKNYRGGVKLTPPSRNRVKWGVFRFFFPGSAHISFSIKGGEAKTSPKSIFHWSRRGVNPHNTPLNVPLKNNILMCLRKLQTYFGKEWDLKNKTKQFKR